MRLRWVINTKKVPVLLSNTSLVAIPQLPNTHPPSLRASHCWATHPCCFRPLSGGVSCTRRTSRHQSPSTRPGYGDAMRHCGGRRHVHTYMYIYSYMNVDETHTNISTHIHCLLVWCPPPTPLTTSLHVYSLSLLFSPVVSILDKCWLRAASLVCCLHSSRQSYGAASVLGPGRRGCDIYRRLSRSSTQADDIS